MNDRQDVTTESYKAGKGNKAIEKMAEERANGLATSDSLYPLESRTYSGHQAMSGSRRKHGSFYEQLSDDEQNAAEAIRLGHAIAAGMLLASTMKFGRVGGFSGDYSEMTLEIMKTYDEWRIAMYRDMPHVLDACLSVFGQGHNFIEAQKDLGGIMSDKTIKKYCMIGLREFVILSK